jgi:hypothetical protein
MSVSVAEVLAIEVGLRGMEQIFSGMEKIATKFGAVEESILKSARAGTVLLGAVLGLEVGGIRAASEMESMVLQLEAIEGSAARAQEKMGGLKEIAARGVFDLPELFQAYRSLEMIGAANERNMRLGEQLAARMGGRGHLVEAMGIIQDLEGGRVARVMNQLREAGISAQQLRQEGVQVNPKGMIESKSPAQVYEAIAKIIERGPDLLSKMGESFDSRWHAMIFGLQELVVTVGTPLLAVMKPVLTVFTAIEQVLARINDMTGGWLGQFVLGSIALVGLGKMVELYTILAARIELAAVWTAVQTTLMKGWGAIVAILETVGYAVNALTDAEKVQAFWTGVNTTLMRGWSGFIGVISAIGKALMTLTSIEKTSAAWAAILDALSGNLPALVGAATIAAGFGVYFGWSALSGGGNESRGSGSNDWSEMPGDRAIRQDDFERAYRRMHARAWTG